MYVLEDTDTASYIQKHISIKLESYTMLSDFLIAYSYLTYNN